MAIVADFVAKSIYTFSSDDKHHGVSRYRARFQHMVTNCRPAVTWTRLDATLIRLRISVKRVIIGVSSQGIKFALVMLS